MSENWKVAVDEKTFEIYIDEATKEGCWEFYSSSKEHSGFGVIAIVIVAFFVFAILRYVRIALSAEYSLIGQIINGFCKIIIPLIAALLILNSVKSSVDLMMQALGCVIACEAVAIPLNPLPKWAYERQKDVRAEERKEAFDYLLDGFFKRKKDE